MKRPSILLSMVLTAMIFSGCSVLDWSIGGVGAIHTTQFVLDASSNGASRGSDQVFSKDRDIMLEQVRTVARAHHFTDKTMTIGGEPKPIAYFETMPPWPCILKVFETNEQLSVELWQYYDKRKQTRLYKEVEAALANELANHFAERLEIRPQRQLRYPWQSD